MKLSERLEIAADEVHYALDLLDRSGKKETSEYAAVSQLQDLTYTAITILRSVESAPVAIMDTRDVLGLCAPAEEDFPALYAIQGQRVALVPLPQQSET